MFFGGVLGVFFFIKLYGGGWYFEFWCCCDLYFNGVVKCGGLRVNGI